MTKLFQLPDPATLLDAILPAVKDAGRMIWAEFHRDGGPRGSGSHATIDLEVERFLRHALLAAHPCDWRGEEMPRQITGHADIWAVDPQDGTRAFLQGHRGPAISIALLRHNLPVLGVVYAPTAPDDGGDLFLWAQGRTASRNGKPLPSLSPRPFGPTTVLAQNEQAGDYALSNHARYAPAGIRAIPSIAYRLALAASGEVDAAISLTHGLDSYDIAGGHALLIGVGGRLVQLDGSPVNHAYGSFAGCIGGSADVVDQVLRCKPQAGGKFQPRHAARPRHRSADPIMLDRAQGALLGLLAGDALGSQVEFLDPATIRARHPQGLRDLRPGGTWNLLVGQPTDDGEMALALARSLIASHGYDAKAAGAAYVAWGNSHPFDMGTTTRQGLAALAGRGRANLSSQANGALMRAAPIGIAAKGAPDRAAVWALQDATLTHPHPVPQAANAAFCAAIAVGVAGGNRQAMFDAAWAMGNMVPDAGAKVIRHCLRAAIDAGPADFMAQQGWVLIALQNAFHRLLAHQPLAQAICETVMQGGDTDTNAAICGALIGAVEGRAALPQLWQSQILGCRAVALPHVAHPRPPTCWADDAMDLAEALIAFA